MPISYYGVRNSLALHPNQVWVVEREDGAKPKASALSPRLDLVVYDSTGFGWGHSRAPAAQLALAILAHALDDDAEAVRLHQRFMLDVIAPLGGDKGFELTKEDVLVEAVRLRLSETGVELMTRQAARGGLR